MWNYIKGVSAPKRKQTTEERRSRDHSYEKKRKRTFRDDWKADRPWLRVEVNTKGEEMMFCDFCIKAGISSDKTSFVKGCTSLKLESIKHHEKGNMHLFAAVKNSNEKKPDEAPAMKAKLSLNKLAMDRLTILFRTVHAINLHGRPARDYHWLSELDEVKGLDVGKVYRSPVKCHEFADAIAEVQRDKIRKHLADSKFVSVIVDGSMDSSITDNEMIYIQTCLQGIVDTHFIRCCQVQRGKAEDIVTAVKRAMVTVIDWKEFLAKLVALGSDGAAVMLGKNSGVITLLQAHQPSMIAVHCSGHRLELAYKDTIKKFPLPEKVVTLLTGLYYMYRNSPLNRANLKEAYRCLGKKVLLPTRAGGTRWVGHVLKALNNFLSGYGAFRLHLEQLAASRERSESKTKAIGFLKLIRSREVIAMALFLQDILTTLHKVSLKFQEENSVVADISLCIKTTITRLKALEKSDGPFYQKLSQYETCSAPSAGAVTRNTYKLTGGNGLEEADRKKILESLCEALAVRFKDTEKGLISATAVANFKIWPLHEAELEGFGDDSIQVLLDQFQAYIAESDLVKAEWPLLRTGIFELFSDKLEALTWKQVNRRFCQEYPNILSLFDLILAIPATSTACEWGFTHMKLVKSNRRTHMKEDSLSNCLTIKLEGSSIKEFDPVPAINHWFHLKPRRPGTGGSEENKAQAAEANLIAMLEGNEDTIDISEEENVQEDAQVLGGGPHW